MMIRKYPILLMNPQKLKSWYPLQCCFCCSTKTTTLTLTKMTAADEMQSPFLSVGKRTNWYQEKETRSAIKSTHKKFCTSSCFFYSISWILLLLLSTLVMFCFYFWNTVFFLYGGRRLRCRMERYGMNILVTIMFFPFLWERLDIL